MIWTEYYDLLCKMDGEQEIKGYPLRDSRRLMMNFDKNKKNT